MTDATSYDAFLDALQWGPPGMGGVRPAEGGYGLNGRLDFNGDLPEWEV